MIAASLLPDDILDDASIDNQQKFYLLAIGARANLLKRLAGDSEDLGPFTEREWKTQYIHELTAAAEVYDILGMVSSANALSSSGGLSQFDQALTQVLTKIRLQRPIKADAESAPLSFTSKENIRQSLHRLRDIVSRSDLPEELKSSLYKRVNAVEAELVEKRFGFKAVWILHGSLALLLQTPALVGMFSDLPGALETVNQITKHAYEDKAYEEKERLRLNPPALTYENPLRLSDGRGDQISS